MLTMELSIEVSGVRNGGLLTLYIELDWEV